MAALLIVTLEPVQIHPRGLWKHTGVAVWKHLLNKLRVSHPELNAALRGGGHQALPVTCSGVLRATRAAPDRIEIAVAVDEMVPQIQAVLDSMDVWTVGKSVFAVRDILEFPRQLIDPEQLRTTNWRVTIESVVGRRKAGPIGQDDQLGALRNALESAAKDAAKLNGRPLGLEVAVDHIAFSELSLRTKRAKAHEATETGLVGWFELSTDTDHALQLSQLMSYIGFMGLGDRRTIGWGRVRCEPVTRRGGHRGRTH